MLILVTLILIFYSALCHDVFELFLCKKSARYKHNMTTSNGDTKNLIIVVGLNVSTLYQRCHNVLC